MQGKVLSVNMGKKKGEGKKPVEEIRLKEGWGVVGDVHGGEARQVSLLSWESIEKQNEKLRGRCPKVKKEGKIGPGDYAENITTRRINLAGLPIGTRLKIGEVILEITHRGKKCHRYCKIYYEIGDCIMPREGVFARVIKGGKVRKGDPIKVVKANEDKGRDSNYQR